ncbi:MAG: MmgE/PrpD family protein [Deltaproteobacteria bacterium]|nr:MmgE/PrpD family protein [Deltaproteobacteria bacterium]
MGKQERNEVETISSIYADFLVRTRFDDLSAEVIQQAKKVILDLIGVSLAGYKMMAFPKLVLDYVLELGGKPEATVIQGKNKIPAVHAVFANASCAHALDMDDGHRFAASHPGAVIVPTAIAAAELTGADTKSLIAGVVAGYDVMIRVGKAINPSSLNRGFHITGITGTFGAAAAAANIMGLSREKIIAALGMAGLQSAGLIRTNHEEEGSMVKPITPARAAVSGLLSCILAKKGAIGPLQIFEGEDGYLKAFADQVNVNALTQKLGVDYEICNIYLKRYAACRHAHACIDAALQAFHRSQIGVEEINSIAVETYPAAIRLAGITDITTPSAARFSIPFSVALALIKKDAGADKYSEENIRDERIQNLSKKVKLSPNKKWEEIYPNQRGATVRIIDKINREWSAEVDLAKGEPENPAAWNEVYQKFFTNASLVLPEGDVKTLENTIMNLEDFALDRLTELL